jgi:phenylacetate-CoA ligase
VSPGTVGRFVCNGLLNLDMPLVRYEVGDRGAFSDEEAGCGCGRTLPRLQGIEGRLNDSIVTADGRRIFWLNPVFYGQPLTEAQIIQEAVDRLRVRIVPSAGYSPEVEDVLASRLRERVGEMEVRFERVSRIPRSANGKFRAVIREWEPSR